MYRLLLLLIVLRQSAASGINGGRGWKEGPPNRFRQNPMNLAEEMQPVRSEPDPIRCRLQHSETRPSEHVTLWGPTATGSPDREAPEEFSLLCSEHKNQTLRKLVARRNRACKQVCFTLESRIGRGSRSEGTLCKIGTATRVLLEFSAFIHRALKRLVAH